MIIEENKVVSIHYELKDDNGVVIDSTDVAEPFEYLHGAANIIPGLESALTGLKLGDATNVDILPADGYGEYDENMIFDVPRTQIENNAEGIQPGMALNSSTGHELYVMEVNDENIKLDGNHPLAGKSLHFAVTIAGVRLATAEEIEHGHPHFEGQEHTHEHGHDHDHECGCQH